MTRILFIRHGVTALTGQILYGRMPGVHISESGTQQALALAHALKHRYTLAQIVSSPLDRAQETARCVQQFCPAEIRLEDGFTELDYGHWLGLPFEEIRKDETWDHYNRCRSTGVPPGGESCMSVQARAWAATSQILDQWQDTESATIAVVSHGDVIRALLMLFLGMPIDHIHRFEIATCSLSEVHFFNHYPKVVTINQTFYE